MRALLLFSVLYASVVSAQSQEERQAGCQFVLSWANQAYHISHTIGLEEDKWHITDDGYPDAVYKMILEIKREAYHDLPALRNRVEMACGTKQES